MLFPHLFNVFSVHMYYITLRYIRYVIKNGSVNSCKFIVHCNSFFTVGFLNIEPMKHRAVYQKVEISFLRFLEMQRLSKLKRLAKGMHFFPSNPQPHK